MNSEGNTLELIGENPHFELRIPVPEEIELELIPCGITGGKKAEDRHRLIISGRGNYSFLLSTRYGEAEFEIFSPEGKLLRKTMARREQDGMAGDLELTPGEYAFRVTAPAPVEYTLRLAGKIF